MIYSVAIPLGVHEQAVKNLIRADGQEDLCFALWHPSDGKKRATALIRELILPIEGEREVQGNVSFFSNYFERALSRATKKNAGLALLHSHPFPGWQDLSIEDTQTESDHAPATMGMTKLPLVGLTLGNNGSWSARFWIRIKPRIYDNYWCESVRVVGDFLKITFNEKILPKPNFRKELTRTISAWGDLKQADLTRVKVGIVGVGSVGSIIAESVARMGVANIKLIDFDSVELLNLDRTLNLSRGDVGKSKVSTIARTIKRNATAENVLVEPIEYGITEEVGYRSALDCDVLFSCVDRPWPRSVLNFIAYAHLIPVVDGGIAVSVNSKGLLRGADWKAHIVGNQRKCLACLEQYDPGLVASEREGQLDDPKYINTLPDDHVMRRNENVFAFSTSTASLQLLQFLSLIIAPYGLSNMGEQNYHFVTGTLDKIYGGKCMSTCRYPKLLALGDSASYVVTGKHAKAEIARRARGGLMFQLRLKVFEKVFLALF